MYDKTHYNKKKNKNNKKKSSFKENWCINNSFFTNIRSRNKKNIFQTLEGEINRPRIGLLI